MLGHGLGPEANIFRLGLEYSGLLALVALVLKLNALTSKAKVLAVKTKTFTLNRGVVRNLLRGTKERVWGTEVRPPAGSRGRLLANYSGMLKALAVTGASQPPTWVVC